ncbi:MAG: hypothetical protein ACR2H2_03150 [Solirubrobacteraceae bacterium]
MAENTCRHEGCTCEARDDGYCSDYCASHGGHESHVAHECHCGHAGCDPDATVK